MHGPGTSTSDSIHGVSLSKGEAVLPAKTVQAVGVGNLARLIQDTNDGIHKLAEVLEILGETVDEDELGDELIEEALA